VFFINNRAKSCNDDAVAFFAIEKKNEGNKKAKEKEKEKENKVEGAKEIQPTIYNIKCTKQKTRINNIERESERQRREEKWKQDKKEKIIDLKENQKESMKESNNSVIVYFKNEVRD